MKNIWRKYLVAAFAILLIAIWVTSLNKDVSKDSASLTKLSLLVSEYNNNKSPLIDFANITQVSWDKVYFFEPYTSHWMIYNSLGFIWLGTKNTTIASSDGVTLIVFVADKRVVSFLEFPRNVADFSDLDNSVGYPYANAKFIINDSGNFELLIR